MEVLGTAFRDVTNATKWSRLQASHGNGHAHPSKTSTHPRNQTPGHSSGVSTHIARQPALLSPASSETSKSSQSVETQRQAKRLHRIRVARIVVDQWMWFTKDRVKMYPAIRHHMHRLMLSAFLALQRHAAHRQLEWRRAAIFNHRRQYLIQGKCLLLWHAQLAYSRRMQDMLRTAQMARQRCLLKTCLVVWKGYRAYKVERRRQNLQASFYNSFVLLSGTLISWRTAAQHAAIKHAKKDRALVFWAVKQSNKALKSWVLGISVKQDSRHKKHQAVSLHKQQLAMSVLRQWHEAVLCVLAAREAGSQALQIVAETLQKSELGQILREWRIISKALHAWRQLKANAPSAFQQAVLRRAFVGWQQHVLENRRLHQVAAKLKPVCKRLHMHTCWTAWTRQYQHQLELQSATLRQAVLLRSCFKTWRATAALEACEQAKLARVVKLMHATFLWRCLQAWRLAADCSQKNRIRKQAARDFYSDKLRRHSLKQWQLCARWSRDSGWKEDLAFHHCSETILIKAMDSWRLAVDAGRQRTKAERWRQAQLMRAVVCAWEHHTCYKLERQRLKRKAIRHRYFANLRLGLSAWRRWQARQHSKRQQQVRLEGVHAHWVRKQAWAAWRHGFMPWARLERAADSRAVAHWRSNVLTGTMGAWAEVTETLVAKSAQHREAAVHHQLVLLTRAMQAWFCWLGMHLASATAKQERLLFLQAVLSKHVKRRLLSAWHDVYIHAVMKRFQMARAQGLHREHVELRALHLWQAYCRKQQRKAAVQAKAVGFARKASMLRGVTGWREVTLHHLAKAAKQAVSQRFWRQRVMRKAFDCWQQQARETAAGLMLVAPYASHWRSITLQRRHPPQPPPLPTPLPHAFHEHSWDLRPSSTEHMPTGLPAGSAGSIGMQGVGVQQRDTDSSLNWQLNPARRPRLQPRRRDFSRSSQGLQHLPSVFHATHHHTHSPPAGSPPAGSPPPEWQNPQLPRDPRYRQSPREWQNILQPRSPPDLQTTLLPRDPSWALPQPHHRPATAAPWVPPAFGHAAPQSQQWSNPSHTYQVTTGHQPTPTTLSHLSPRDYFNGSQQVRVGPASACGDDGAVAAYPHHLHGGLGQGGPGRDLSLRQHGNGWAPPASVHAAATRSMGGERALDAKGAQSWRMGQPTSQAQHTSARQHSQHTARHVLPQPVPERRRTHSTEPDYQHEHLSQQPQSAECGAAVHEHPGSSFEWWACSPGDRDHHQEPSSLSHQRAAACALKQGTHGAVYAAQPADVTHMRQPEDSARSNQQVSDAGNIAAMEMVLSEYKALRSQISEAEAQLLGLQKAQSDYDPLGWSQTSSCSSTSEHISRGGPRHGVWSKRSDLGIKSSVVHAHWMELTNTLRALKAAAARQRPAVEAVASQLQSTLSRVHAASTARANQ